MARTPRPTPRRRRFVALAGVVAAVALAGCGTPYLTDPADSRPPLSTDSTNGEQVIVCESGTVSSDRIETSSAVAARVPAGTPVPPGCRDG
jgi:hypothetical protein